MTLFGYLFFAKPANPASVLGKLGGQARAQQMRAPIREKAREMRAQCGLAPDRRLAG